jgi:S1-C subfamily serine protease
MVLSDTQADLLNLPPRASGFIVKTVAKGSPADEIGLRGSTQVVNIGGGEIPLCGDIILTVDGIPASAANLAKIRDILSKLSPGAAYKVGVLRAGQVVDLTGKLP